MLMQILPLQIRITLYLKYTTQKFSWSSMQVIDILVAPVATKPCIITCLFNFEQTEVLSRSIASR